MSINENLRPWTSANKDQSSAWFNYGFNEQTFCQHINQYIKNSIKEVKEKPP
jgi:hypothetical protein